MTDFIFLKQGEAFFFTCLHILFILETLPCIKVGQQGVYYWQSSALMVYCVTAQNTLVFGAKYVLIYVTLQDHTNPTCMLCIFVSLAHSDVQQTCKLKTITLIMPAVWS